LETFIFFCSKRQNFKTGYFSMHDRFFRHCRINYSSPLVRSGMPNFLLSSTSHKNIFSSIQI
jgi:hypothetical protein